jgi:uncharacterized membrane protein YgcG
VVTVDDTAPAFSPKAFTTELFNYWGISKKGQDNGVLFLIPLGDRRVEINIDFHATKSPKDFPIFRGLTPQGCVNYY